MCWMTKTCRKCPALLLCLADKVTHYIDSRGRRFIEHWPMGLRSTNSAVFNARVSTACSHSVKPTLSFSVVKYDFRTEGEHGSA